MDYLFSPVSKDADFIRLISSYDIACQWWVHLWERMVALPEYLHINLAGKHVIFWSRNFIFLLKRRLLSNCFFVLISRAELAEQTEKAPERGWSNINPLSAQTKVMGPASRRETIDDHFNDWNHKKVIGLGAYFVYNQLVYKLLI